MLKYPHMMQIRGMYHKLRAVLACIYYGFPSKRLKMIGVTGTDGKTTTVSLIYSILRTAKKRVAMISTVEAKIGAETIDTGFHTTTPNPFLLNKLLKKCVDKKMEFVVLETTSHALSQHRVWGINFDIGVLTNITHEHLDYHKTFRNYIDSKEKLFKFSKVGILNRKYASLIGFEGKKILYDYKSLNGVLRKTVLTRFNEPYNFLNATAAVLVAKEIGMEEKYISNAIRNFWGVAGRMEEIENTRGIRAIIDFAHTPNSLTNVLGVLRKQRPKSKKLVVVFGCAGERDVKKRPMMGKAATDIADISVLTAEDPRSEKVEDIISQISKGIKNKNAVVYKISDRGEAIDFAINNLAKAGDIVVVCGKGHERSMSYNGVEHPWSDKKAINKAFLSKSRGTVLKQSDKTK